MCAESEQYSQSIWYQATSHRPKSLLNAAKYGKEPLKITIATTSKDDFTKDNLRNEFEDLNANTEEEGLKKPAAVGLYHRDMTPEGIADLAGNVAEWTMDVVENKIVIHPGSWNVNSLGAWAKASSLISPAARIGDLGFRLVRDID